ncbi:hypothetical protein AB0A77_28365 [Streptomyces varsoviensis]|uniref:hypothetical protein n=1 Tax=Streptomyces varsoviensis TaxID=67373 RepID=UPI0033D52EAA
MSDHEDAQLEEVYSHLAHTYMLISHACRSLPVPIALPVSKEAADFGVLIDAVGRVTEIIEEVPIPEMVQGELMGSCLCWLAATSCVSVHAQDPKVFHLMAAVASLLNADDFIGDVLRWVSDQD